VSPSGEPRRASGPAEYWLAGRRPVALALRAGRVRRLLLAEGAGGLDELAAQAAAAGVPCLRRPRAEVDRAAGEPAHGCAALVAPPPPAGLDDVLAAAGTGPALLVALDHLQDGRNVGAIARTAVAVGAAGLIVPSRRAAPLGAAAERASAGTLGALPCAVVHNLSRALDRCRAARFWIYGAASDGSQLHASTDWDRRAVLLLGAEGPGLGPELRRRCDVLVRLPMWGDVESLNAAVAAGILLYEWARRWREPAAAAGGPAPGARPPH
jgi:23S rRNA (guanosine2251-2'-O)-methyltransferase